MKFRNFAASTLLALALTTQVYANEGCNKDAALNIDAALGMTAFPYRLFHADGEHQCWSKDFIGYKCTVSHAAIYTDCNAAFFGLKRDNCCSRMYWKGKRLEDGRSIDFKMTKCTNWT